MIGIHIEQIKNFRFTITYMRCAARQAVVAVANTDSRIAAASYYEISDASVQQYCTGALPDLDTALKILEKDCESNPDRALISQNLPEQESLNDESM